MPREVVISLAFIAVMFGAMTWFFWPQSTPLRAHHLGQELLLAAERRDWAEVKALLDEGADPDVTELDPSQAFHSSLFNIRLPFFFGSSRPISPSMLKRPAALGQAARQDNLEAAKMLLAYHAKVTEEVRNMVTGCGDRELIAYVEEAGHIPANKRSLPSAPFTAAANSPRETVMTSVSNAGPVSHYLWLSPHELLLERGGSAPSIAWSFHASRPIPAGVAMPGTPPRFFAFDLDTQAETELPDLTRAWADQPEFDPDMLALSPDGQWLLGFGGTANHPTWRATQVHGSGVQAWDRVAERDPKKRGWLGAHPLIAWRDNTRWVEVNQPGPGYVVRLRTLGAAETQELPIASGYGISTGYDHAVFGFSDPDHALSAGPVGVTFNRETGPQFVLEWVGLTAGPGGWTSEKRGFEVSSADQPGGMMRCLPAPDGRRLAWLQICANGLARDIQLSDADGSHFRVAREWLSTNRDLTAKRREMPGYRSMEWMPDGSKLIYWRGDKGEDGLALLPIGPEE